MKIAYLGKLTFTHELYEKCLKNGNDVLISCKTLAEIADAVRNNEAELGILPLENRIIGKINGYDLNNLKIIKKIKLPIKMSLGGIGDEKDVKHVISKKEVFYQCSNYIKKKKLQIIEEKSTVSGINRILKHNLKDTAVICSEKALKINNLRVYREDISNIKPNYTIFGLIRSK